MRNLYFSQVFFFPKVDVDGKLIVVFKRACDWTLFWACWAEYKPSHAI